MPDATAIRRCTSEYATIAELAEREGIAPSCMTRVSRLSPETIEAVLDGSQGPDLTLGRLLEPFPEIWEMQPVYNAGDRITIVADGRQALSQRSPSPTSSNATGSPRRYPAQPPAPPPPEASVSAIWGNSRPAEAGRKGAQENMRSKIKLIVADRGG